MSLPFDQKNECFILQAASSGQGFTGTLPVCLPPCDILLCPAVCHEVLAFLGVHRRNRLGPFMSLEEAADSLSWQGLPLAQLALEATAALSPTKVDTNSSHRLLFCASSHGAMGGSQR